ncbi:type II toxin-antitoxin system HicB family antitoxin [Simkania negevensis]|uniref:Type II toxin-antitoxin system HicB family antitoxin n=1 Tax=Simkania negevensis TaxID=83561 RepID=A0ABS3APP7_9BACT|nr:type II toxin-antitoxin system HicB family antitoxin [Simkania negevensis]
MTNRTFQGNNVAKLEKAFRESVEEYLAFCKERGEQPNKPYSGKFNLRIPPELHAKLAIAAKANEESLNSFIAHTLDKAVGE